MDESGIRPAGDALALRMAAAPRLAAGEAAHARLEQWLAEIAATPAGGTLARLLTDHPTVRTLIAALADGAPYLWDLACADPARLAGLLQSEPDRRFVDLLADATRGLAAAAGGAQVRR